MSDNTNLIFSMQRVLLGAIKPHYRAVLAGISLTTIHLTLVTENEATEGDKAALSVIGAQVLADFPGIKKIEESILSNHEKPESLLVTPLTYIAFRRAEGHLS